ncbi:MAG TPA: DEAD/DEAH box helicase, partial [Ktedonobacteraceae bacterium]|nr:DEAD/DEAH box helicase [Ktedonobacteraceae bacterium]
PIENGKLEELFSIMQWVDPTVLGSWQSFEENYIVRVTGTNIIDYYKNVNELHERLMNACIVKRRTDPDVSQFMPTVEEYNVYIKLDHRTRELYRRVTEDILQAIYKSGPGGGSDLAAFYAGDKDSDSSGGLGELGSRLVGASLLLASPELVRDSAWRSEASGGEEGSKYAKTLSYALRDLPEPFYGVKLEACTELAIDYLKEDPRHKVIIFSRFKGILPLLQKELSEYNSVLFTGDMNGKQRGKAIAQFTNDPDCRLFLSSDAGGYGVDLYAASHLINYDLPLSSGVRKQRNGRHVRASSTFRHVYIDNLIVEDTIEEYFLSRLDHKDKVAKAALTGVSHPSGNVFDTTDSLTRFLKNKTEKHK